MIRSARRILVFIAISLGGSITASLLDAPLIAFLVGLPALVLCGCVFIGHFVTLDDDMPGAWSNPDRSYRIWLFSLTELAAKGAALALVVWLVMFFPFKVGA